MLTKQVFWELSHLFCIPSPFELKVTCTKLPFSLVSWTWHPPPPHCQVTQGNLVKLFLESFHHSKNIFAFLSLLKAMFTHLIFCIAKSVFPFQAANHKYSGPPPSSPNLGSWICNSSWVGFVCYATSGSWSVSWQLPQSWRKFRENIFLASYFAHAFQPTAKVSSIGNGGVSGFGFYVPLLMKLLYTESCHWSLYPRYCFLTDGVCPASLTLFKNLLLENV